jgi:putative peptidoglycan lipid II flippase
MAGLPVALLGQAVGQAAFPRLAAAAAAFDWQAMRVTLLRSLAAVVALALPALLTMVFLGRWVVALIFEHGLFGDSAGDLTAKVLSAYAVALPAYVATEVITRGLIALRDTRTPLLTNAAQLVGRGVIVAALVGGSGVVAIPIAFAVTASIETALLGSILALKLRRRMAAMR